MQIETLRREQEKAQAKEQVHTGKQPLSPIEQVRLSESIRKPDVACQSIVAQLEKSWLLRKMVSVDLRAHV